MIELINISKKYGDKKIFENLNIVFKDNCINILKGPSGSGKTTLLNIISGLDTDYIGKNNNTYGSISYLFQEDRLIPHLNILDNVIFTLPEFMTNDEKTAAAKNALDKLELDTEYYSYPSSLSGGMSRRAAIARSIAYPSDLLLLDEPFNGLNQLLKVSVADILDNEHLGTKKTIILVSHDDNIVSNIKNANVIEIF